MDFSSGNFLAVFVDLCRNGQTRSLAMAAMNVSLPDSLNDWVEAQARAGGYGNPSDYVRDLIRRDQQRNQKIVAMRKLVDEGIAS
ncbi:type II toxin-antitoxin system ParD family antitoxin, partial [Staphylococcus aureus]